MQAKYLSVAGMFLVGLPLAYCTCFVLDFGINGLWYGFGGGLLVQTVLYTGLILKTDWYQISENVQDELQRQEEIEIQNQKEEQDFGSEAQESDAFEAV